MKKHWHLVVNSVVHLTLLQSISEVRVLCRRVCLCVNRLPRIYDQLRQTINMSDASKDLKWWSQNHGVEMPMLWPTFEVVFVSSARYTFSVLVILPCI